MSRLNPSRVLMYGFWGGSEPVFRLAVDAWREMRESGLLKFPSRPGGSVENGWPGLLEDWQRWSVRPGRTNGTVRRLIWHVSLGFCLGVYWAESLDHGCADEG